SPRDYADSLMDAAKAGALPRRLADELIASVGMRNAIAQEYLNVDYAHVAADIPLALDGYRRYRRAVADFANAHPSPDDPDARYSPDRFPRPWPAQRASDR